MKASGYFPELHLLIRCPGYKQNERNKLPALSKLSLWGSARIHTVTYNVYCKAAWIGVSPRNSCIKFNADKDNSDPSSCLLTN